MRQRTSAEVIDDPKVKHKLNIVPSTAKKMNESFLFQIFKFCNVPNMLLFLLYRLTDGNV